MTDESRHSERLRLGIGGFGLGMMLIAMAIVSAEARQSGEDAKLVDPIAEAPSIRLTNSPISRETMADCAARPLVEQFPNPGGTPANAGLLAST